MTLSESTRMTISQLLWDNTNDLIVVLNGDHDLTFEWIDEIKFKLVLGYSSEEVLGASFLSYLNPKDARKFIKLLSKRSLSSSPKIEVRLKSKRNEEVWFELKICEFLDDHNENKYFCIFKSILEKKKLKYQLKKRSNLILMTCFIMKT